MGNATQARDTWEPPKVRQDPSVVAVTRHAFRHALQVPKPWLKGRRHGPFVLILSPLDRVGAHSLVPLLLFCASRPSSTLALSTLARTRTRSHPTTCARSQASHSSPPRPSPHPSRAARRPCPAQRRSPRSRQVSACPRRFRPPVRHPHPPSSARTADHKYTGFGDCFSPVIGTNGKNASVPCACPPTQAAFLVALTADVLAGHAVHNPSVQVTFPTGSSIQDAQSRISTAAVTLQNLHGPGQGCPIVSTFLSAQSKALDALAAKGVSVAPATGATVAPAKVAISSATKAAVKTTAAAAATTSAAAVNISPAAAAPPPASSGVPTASQIAQLAPDLGVTAPLPPTGFGDCVGPNLNAAGKPISVPCSCPPSKAAFIAALTADVLAGHAVHNPTVKVTFPTGDSVQDKLGRISAAAVTLQNLNGPGQGCPFVSTTLPAQSKALQALAA